MMKTIRTNREPRHFFRVKLFLFFCCFISLYEEHSTLLAQGEAEEIAWAIEELYAFHTEQFPLSRNPCIDSKTLRFLIHEKRYDFLSRYIFDFEYPLYEVQEKETLLRLLTSLSDFIFRKKKSFTRAEKIATKLLKQLKKKPTLERPIDAKVSSSHLGYFYEQARIHQKYQDLYWEARRTQDRLNWMLFEFQVIEQNLALLRDFVEHRLTQIWRKGIIAYPGGNGILTRSRDFAEVQRQVQEALVMEESEILFLHQKVPVFEGYGVLFQQRAFFYRLYTKFQGTVAEKWLRDSLKKSYDLTYLNHLFWRYREENLEKEVIRLIELYLKRPNATRLGFLEVLFYRPGAFNTSHFAQDRFIPEMWSYAQKLNVGKSRKELYQQAAQYTQEITQTMRYGTANTLRFAFDQKTVDCIRSSNICGAILANAGVDQIYPVFLSSGGGTHALSCILEEGQFLAIDTGAGKTQLFSFPRQKQLVSSEEERLSETAQRNLQGRAVFMEENYYRALASWTNWKIFVNYQKEGIEIEIPYFKEN